MQDDGNATEKITCQRRHHLSTVTFPSCTRINCYCSVQKIDSDVGTLCSGKTVVSHFNFSLTPKLLNFLSKLMVYEEFYLTPADKRKTKFRRKSMFSEFYTVLVCIVFLITPVTLVNAYERGNPPHVVATEVTPMTAYKGQTLNLPCMVSGNPPPKAVWWKDGIPVGRDWKRFRQQGMSLRIRNIQISDSGMFSCEAVNGFGSKRVEVELRVYDETRTDSARRREASKPMFSQPVRMRRHSIVKKLGSTVSFRCKAKGKPRPQIQWFKDGNLTELKISGGTARPQWILTLRLIRADDSGRYTCRVWNSVGEISFDYTLKVIGSDQNERPVLLKPHPVNTTVRVGDKAALQCHVRSVVRPTIKWIKRLDPASLQASDQKWPNNSLKIDEKLYLILPPQEMMVLQDGSYLNKLVIENVKKSDSGVYICLGANTMGYNFRYAFLTVQPRHAVSDSSASKSFQESPPLAFIIGLPAAVGLVLVCIVTAYCLCERDRFGRFTRRSTKTPSVPPHPIPSSALYNEAVRDPTSRSDEITSVRRTCEQEACDTHLHQCKEDAACPDLNSPASRCSSENDPSKMPLCDSNTAYQSESDAGGRFIPPPPPPSQYSRSSSTDVAHRHRGHHSCHRSNRNRHHSHHHHPYRYRNPPGSISSQSHSYCSHIHEYY